MYMHTLALTKEAGPSNVPAIGADKTYERPNNCSILRVSGPTESITGKTCAARALRARCALLLPTFAVSSPRTY